MEYDCTFFFYNDHFVKKNYVWVNASILLVHFWTSRAYFSSYQFLVDMTADKSSDDPSKVDHVSYHECGIEDDNPNELLLDIQIPLPESINDPSAFPSVHVSTDLVRCALCMDVYGIVFESVVSNYCPLSIMLWIG